MIKCDYDLIVAGVGFAGFAASLAAAREGCSVLVIDKNNCPGGAAACCLVNPFMPFTTKNSKTGETIQLARGIFKEVYDKLAEYGAVNKKAIFNEEYLKIIMNRMLIEAGVNILFDSYLIDAEMKDEKVHSITLACKAQKLTYTASYFIDATGDADLSVLCGYPYHLGREKDNLCQPMTLCFRIANVDVKKHWEERDAICEKYEQYRKEGKIKNPRENILVFNNLIDDVLHFNTTRIILKNPINPIERTEAEIEAREQVFEVFNFLKDNFESFKNSKILMTSSEIGVRESRMVEGEYVLTREDLVSCRKFDDSIAVCNYDIDIHNPEGSGTSHYYFKPGEYYTIPYRCLIPKNSKNLLVAGRCISSTHEAQASYRVMPVCCCLGQAAGIAAAFAVKNKTDVNKIDIKAYQNRLKECNLMIK